MPKPMSSPREMTPAEWAQHRITHLPYNGACPHCLAGKRNNLPHCRSRTERKLPHLVADYCYLRDSVSDVTLTTLVVYILPFRIYFSTVVDAKGPTPMVVKRLSRLVREIGLTHYTYRSDRELALRNLLMGCCFGDWHTRRQYRGSQRRCPRASGRTCPRSGRS